MNLRTLLFGQVVGAAAIAGAASCAQPECVVPDYRDPECRVLVENEVARLSAAGGLELRFHDPAAPELDSWAALGVLQAGADGRVQARVAGLGDFLLSARAPASGPATATIDVDNVDPSATVTVMPATALVETAPAAGLRRTVTVRAEVGEVVTIRGERPCPGRFNLAFVGDVQTNPLQFARILERMAADAAALAAAGEPLLGLVLVGDLTEWSYDEEFRAIAGILARAPTPVAVTPGNHDIFRKIVASYNMIFGPGTYATSICGVRVALFDSGSAELARSIEGRLPELFERGDDALLIAATHIPPHFALTGDGWTREDQAQVVLGELALAEADLLIAGHVHALRDFQAVEAGEHSLREIVVGTGGATQGVGVARFGYLRVRIDGAARPAPCFVEVPPPGWGGPANAPLSAALPYCE